ncbi:MAG: ferredoxin:thioredoxin reductase [Candidatus Diapherotrites archaeon]|nr:ferredoxin:thioredoxin reductase [Candidatus Diapherotrites archaeon]
MNKEEFRRICAQYCEGGDFALNPDAAFLEDVLDGVMQKQAETGLRYCPCRLTTGDFEKDIDLLCPCFFRAQEKWKTKGECWCSLFVKK